MQETFLGIDISKKTFDVALIINGRYKTKKFNNNLSGFKQLQCWLDRQKETLLQACMEATGIYGQALAEFLYTQKIPVSVVNPAKIKGFSQSELTRSKNDQLDAKLIARYCERMRPRLWKPAPKATKILQQYVMRLDDLIKMHGQESNRLGVADECVKGVIRKHIAWVEDQMEEMRELIKNHVNRDADLKDKSRLLQSIPGIGERTTTQILAHLGDINRYKTAKEVAAFAGLNPRQRQSGSSVKGRTRLSKVGSPVLRKALYMPAIVAMKHNPIIRNFASRLEQAGHHKMSIIGAIMRKLIHMIYGILKSGKEFDENILKKA